MRIYLILLVCLFGGHAVRLERSLGSKRIVSEKGEPVKRNPKEGEGSKEYCSKRKNCDDQENDCNPNENGPRKKCPRNEEQCII